MPIILIQRSCQSGASDSKSQAHFNNYQLGSHRAKHTCPHWNTNWKTIICKHKLCVCIYMNAHAENQHQNGCMHAGLCIWGFIYLFFPRPFVSLVLPLTPVVKYVYVHFWILVGKLVMLISHSVLQLHQGDSLRKGGMFFYANGSEDEEKPEQS